jgi:hypothetical protein
MSDDDAGQHETVYQPKQQQIIPCPHVNKSTTAAASIISS